MKKLLNSVGARLAAALLACLGGATVVGRSCDAPRISKDDICAAVDVAHLLCSRKPSSEAATGLPARREEWGRPLGPRGCPEGYERRGDWCWTALVAAPRDGSRCPQGSYADAGRCWVPLVDRTGGEPRAEPPVTRIPPASRR